MPVKWTPDVDQLLLLKILETHDIHLDTKKISAAWPTDQGEVPTARAITERLVKIRKDAKAHFGISSSQSQTARAPGSAPKDATKSTQRKSKVRPASASDDEDESPTKRKRANGTAETTIKAESIESDEMKRGTLSSASTSFRMPSTPSSRSTTASTSTPAPNSFQSPAPATIASTNGFRIPPSSNHSPSPAHPVNSTSAPWSNHPPYNAQAAHVTTPMRNLTFGNSNHTSSFGSSTTRQPDFVDLSCDDAQKQTPTKQVQVKQEMMRKPAFNQEPVRRMLPVDSFDDAI